jgi:hypothetical protein
MSLPSPEKAPCKSWTGDFMGPEANLAAVVNKFPAFPGNKFGRIAHNRAILADVRNHVQN